jgi:hypothetical protein
VLIGADARRPSSSAAVRSIAELQEPRDVLVSQYPFGPSGRPSIMTTEPHQSWQRFLGTYEPLRTELYRYCRYLTRSPWDAEDLAQDTLGRAFVTIAQGSEPDNPRAWLFRVASNLWIDQMADGTAPIAPDLVVGVLADAPRLEARWHRDRWLLVHWYKHTDGEAVRALTMVEVAGDGDAGRIARLRNYFYTADFIADLGGELEVPTRTNGYRWWLS